MLGFSAGWEGGATKFVLTDLLQVRNNCVHDNLGPGIWMDVENRNSTIVDNLVSPQSWNRHIQRGRALIEGNIVAFNGSPGETSWNLQILASGLIDMLVQRNRVEVAPDTAMRSLIWRKGGETDS